MHEVCLDHVSPLFPEGEMTESFNLIPHLDEISYMLHQIDPFNNKVITYSEVVGMLSCYMVTSENPL